MAILRVRARHLRYSWFRVIVHDQRGQAEEAVAAMRFPVLKAACRTPMLRRKTSDWGWQIDPVGLRYSFIVNCTNAIKAAVYCRKRFWLARQR